MRFPGGFLAVPGETWRFDAVFHEVAGGTPPPTPPKSIYTGSSYWIFASPVSFTMNQLVAAVHAQNALLAADLGLAGVLYRRRLERRRQARPRRFWVRNWLSRRDDLGWYATLMRELEQEDPTSFQNFLRVEPAMFHELLGRLTPIIEKQDTNYRKAIPAGMKLAITLRFLATGDSTKTLGYGFRVAHNTIAKIIPEVCTAIRHVYEDEVVVTPSTPDQWLAVAEGFHQSWNLPHTCGAIDGKHVALRCPPRGGSYYYNYKGYHSIVLLAIVDANYKFLWVDIGANGASSDAQIFNDTELKEVIEAGRLGLPPDEPLPHDDRPMPYFFIGDDAFALKTWMMKPFSRRNLTDEERIFNYRLSRPRRVVENAFGILANRFGCLLRTLPQSPAVVVKIVMAAVCLHNIMRTRYPALHIHLLDQENEQHDVIAGAWRRDVQMDDIQALGRGNRATVAAQRQRLYLKHYVNNPVGSVPWQRAMAFV